MSLPMREIYYILRCPKCQLALSESRHIRELPIENNHYCYGCDSYVDLSYNDVEIKVRTRDIEDLIFKSGDTEC